MKNYLSILFFMLLSAATFAQVNTESTPVLEFQETQYDFGTIKEGDVATHEYKFTNTGNGPLVITSAKGSCGCTVPEWPKEPILPGASGTIKVSFNSKNKPGKQSKRVTLTANTDPAQSYLTITGQVEADKNKKSKVAVNKPSSKNHDGHNHSAKKHDAKDCFAIFPNPTTDVLKIELKEYFGKDADIRILDSSGKLMGLKMVKEISEDLIEFQVSNYNPGTYYVNMQIDKKLISTKCFVVAKN